MAKLSWDDVGQRLYETGIRNGVLYPYVTGDGTEQNPSGYLNGVAWNGLTAVTESPSGADETALYADDIKYLSLRATEEFGGTIEAYTYPDEWMECDGSKEIATGVVIGQQPRKMFGLCYRTAVGNDTQNEDHGYKLHLVYGATASPSERNYQTINDSPEAITFSWEFTTNPVAVKDHKPTALLTIDSTKFVTEAEKTKLAAIEAALYGTQSSSPYLPLPGKILELLGE